MDIWPILATEINASVWDFCEVSFKERLPYSSPFLLNVQNMDKIAGAPGAIPDHEENLRIEASAEKGRAEREDLRPRGYWDVKTAHEKEITTIWC